MPEGQVQGIRRCKHGVRQMRRGRPQQVAAGVFYTVLLRSDVTVVACGNNAYEQCNIPALDEGLMYSDVFAGFRHTVLLRSDGTVVACGRNGEG